MKNDSEKRPECQMRRTLKRAHAPLRLATSDNADVGQTADRSPTRENPRRSTASPTLVRVCREARLSRKLARYIYFLGNEPKLEALRKGNGYGREQAWVLSEQRATRAIYFERSSSTRNTRVVQHPRAYPRSIRDPPSSLVRREIIIVGERTTKRCTRCISDNDTSQAGWSRSSKLTIGYDR